MAIAACLLQAAGCSSIPNAPDQGAATATPDTQALALACTSCHAASLGSPESQLGRALPELYGRRATSLKQQLLGYKRGTRQGTLMPRIARAYSEQELSELADYFANTRATP